MRFGLALIPRLRGVDEELTARGEGDEVVFPAGVVALGRGGAGDLAALLLPDGRLAGLLRLQGSGAHGADEVYALAAGLPAADCQVVTARRPVDLERQIAAWSAATRARGGRGERAALADHFADEHLPDLGAAGWSETQTLLALFGDDAEGLRGAIDGALRTLPPNLAARPASLRELKDLAGGWLAPLASGQVTIGWWLSELAGEPEPGWPRRLLEAPALRGLPLTLTLHLGPLTTAAPISLEDHRQARQGRRDLLPDSAATRSARLLIACTVDPLVARRVRAEVEGELDRLGFRVGAIGPARSYETLLSCAPLGEPTVGRSIAVSGDDAALLVPLPTAGARSAQAPADLLPLGLHDDGTAFTLADGAPLLLVGGAGAARRDAAQGWALARAAAGFAVTVVDTGGAWQAAALAGGGQRIAVGAHLGAILGRLGCDLEPVSRAQARTAEAREAIDRWVTVTAAMLADLCPALSEDDRGDLTATLLDLADEQLAGRGKASGRRLLRRLRDQGSAGAAAALGPLLAASGAPRRVQPDDPHGPPMTVFDTTGEGAPEGPGGPRQGLLAAGLGAALERVGAIERQPVRGQVIVLDDLAALLDAPAGTVLLAELLRRARRAGAAVWCVAASLAACPEGAAAAMRAAGPAGVILRQDQGERQATARWFGLPPTLLADLDGSDPDLALVADGVHCAPLRIVPDALIARLAFRRRRERQAGTGRVRVVRVGRPASGLPEAEAGD